MTSSYLFTAYSKLTAAILLLVTAALCSSLITVFFKGLRAVIEHSTIVHS